MTVSELIELLKNFSEDSDVLITNELVDNENLDIARVESKKGRVVLHTAD
jgi:hypothetical protein